MHKWFEVGICYEKVMDNGKSKKVTEPYLIDALSFTEAEARIIEHVTPYISGEFSVRTIKPANICELFRNNQGERFYKCRVNFITLNKKGKEKRTASYMLVEANSTDTAEKRLKEGMEGTMADYDIEAIVETKIMDVYSYEVPAETEENK